MTNSPERIHINVLDLSLRTFNVLSQTRIQFIDELEAITAEELVNLRYVGNKTIREIRKELARYGTSLKGDYVANSPQDKQLIENIPNHLREIRNQVWDLQQAVAALYKTLDRLHLDMKPKDKHTGQK